MAERPCRYQEWNDQHERIEIEVEQLHKSQPPNGAYHPRDGGPQCAAPVVEIEVEQPPHHEHCDNEDFENLRCVAINPSVLNRLPADIDTDGLVTHRAHDDFVDVV